MASKVKTLNHLLTAWDDTKLRVAEDQQQNALVLIILIGHYLFIHMSFQNCIVLFFCVHLVITLERTERFDKYGLRLNVFDSCSRQESCCVCLYYQDVCWCPQGLCVQGWGVRRRRRWCTWPPRMLVKTTAPSVQCNGCACVILLISVVLVVVEVSSISLFHAKIVWWWVCSQFHFREGASGS